eukprot:7384786-Prymnesium_polylepis.8
MCHAERIAAIWALDENKRVCRFAVLVASSDRRLEGLTHIPVDPRTPHDVERVCDVAVFDEDNSDSTSSRGAQ